MLYIRFSNQPEVLLEALLERSVAETESPFAPIEILVPSAGIRRRIEMAAADEFGICANVRFSFLAQWLWQQIGRLVDVRAESPFAPAVLSWRIFGLFADQELIASHPRLAGYLNNADPVMRLELAERTAAVFEQYMTYRPDWLEQWLEGETVKIPGANETHKEDQRWQMAVWTRLIDSLGIGRKHPSTAFFDKLASLDVAPAAALRRAGLPQRVHVFCLPAMPPLYLDMLRRLGKWIDIELYVLNPCQEYWFEIVDRRRLSYLASREQDTYHEVGNRLLAAWGKQSQSYVDLLLDDAGQATVEQSRFEKPADNTLLGQVQTAVLEMRDLEAGSILMSEHDRSIEVHVCHTLTRELEVLHDRLLALFAAANPPRPADILVVTPDLEAAAPLIDAVFGSAPSARRIPYTITGRPGSLVNPVAAALLDLLTLATSRYQAGTVFALLQQPLVGHRFGVGPDELETIRTWVVESGIRWGIDADHRERFELPRSDRHSFRDGLNRLFLGYALPSAISLPFNARIASASPEGGDAAALGSFRHFFRRLEDLHRELAEPKLPDAWKHTLLAMMETFLEPGHELVDDLREVQQAVARLTADMHGGGIAEEVPAAVIKSALQGLLDDPTMGGTPTGAVTFSSMTSLRNLPYRNVCIVGLRDGAFPTLSRPAEFDLMTLAPRRGDRQRRSDERNLFLDLLLAARDRFYISYTGKSVRDNASLPPSVLVADLLDYLVPAIAADPHSADSLRAARARLVVEHPLQPFSASYFSGSADPRFASFNDEYCAALKKRLEMASNIAIADSVDEDEEAVREALPLFFTGRLPELEAEWRTVSLDQLAQFFRNPCRYLLRHRLGIGMADAILELTDDEPLLPEWSGRESLARRLLPHLLKGASDSEIRTLAAAGLEYPPGTIGEILMGEELRTLTQFAATLSDRIKTECLPAVSHSVEFDIDGSAWRLHGALGDVRPHGLVRHRYDDTRASDYLSAWLSHLFLNAARCDGVTRETHWISRDGEFRLMPCDDARDCLRQLVELYRHGLCEPLHFFPKSSWEYVKKGNNISAAGNVWRSSIFRSHGEERHEAYQLALRGIDDPLGEHFESAAKAVFGPMMSHLHDERLA